MRSRNKSKSFWKEMTRNRKQPKPVKHSKGSPEKEVFNTDLPKINRETTNKQPNPTPTRTQTTTTKTAQSK